jgi:hypothetical protein
MDGQTPEEITRKITELVHAGKYAEAQKLTEAMLIAYPNDQRLIKAKALIAQLLASAGSTSAAPITSQSTQPATNSAPEALAGMDKVDYSALIVLARQALQSADLDEQNKLLRQFVDQSSKFLQRHPDQMLLWQLRATAALSLDDAMAGFEAGQHLIARGAADSGDQSLLQLLGQLKNKGWLDKQEAEKQIETNKYTLPLAKRTDGEFNNRGYMTVSENSAEFDGSIDRVSLSKDDIREIDIRGRNGGQCRDLCEFVFVHKRNALDIGFMPITRAAVADGTNDALSLTPFVDAFADKWGFIRMGDTLQPTVGKPVLHKGNGWAPPAQKSDAPGGQTSAPMDDRGSSAAAASETHDSAILHVYRMKHFAGGGASYGVYIDGKKVVPIQNGQTIRMLLAAGKHSVSAAVRGVKTRNPLDDLDLAAGKEYWVRIDLGVGFPMDYFIVTLVPGDQAQAESGRLEEIKMGDLSKN